MAGEHVRAGNFGVPNAGRVLFTRTNLVPYTVDFAAEALAVNGGGGDDQLTVSPGLPGLLVTADGGSGNDSLTGAEEADSLVGGAGNDTLTGGGGAATSSTARMATTGCSPATATATSSAAARALTAPKRTR